MNRSVLFSRHLLLISTIGLFSSAACLGESQADFEDRLEAAKMELWARGAFALDENFWFGENLQEQVSGMEWHTARLGPVREARRSRLGEEHFCAARDCLLTSIRGGGAVDYNQQLESKIEELAVKFGPSFVDAINQNKKEHAEDCEQSCEMYYCAKPNVDLPPLSEILGDSTDVMSYSMGAVPPEDFAEEFGFPLDLIKVTKGKPLFSRAEAKQVIQKAEEEGVDKNEYQSGKYKLGGDWLTNLPSTRAWFNEKLEKVFFPLLSHAFPEVVTSQSVLRAHSVSLLKYNSSHPRTDVHIDNGILAMTLAMTPTEEYTGGGTFFEHFDTVLPMDVGHGTFRPGSVRHGGHRVTGGTRYILGAFLLIEDRVEHVRRLKNRGSELRRAGDLKAAEDHFEWALALNPKCTTCLKDWAEILHSKNDFEAAETKIRSALQLLENKDSDALFTLGLLLSQQGRDEESIEAYKESVKLNSEDAELLYNLGIKLGDRGEKQEEMKMYALCTQVNPKFGGAWLNWGTTLAEMDNMDDAELMFLKALECEDEVRPKAMVNLGLIYYKRSGASIQTQNIAAAKEAALTASSYLDSAKPLLDALVAIGKDDLAPYVAQHNALRLQCHRNMGQIYAGTGDMAACEQEFRKATESFPQELMAWQMLGRVLEIQGKADEMQHVFAKVQQLRGI